jgi:hypothetical protein
MSWWTEGGRGFGTRATLPNSATRRRNQPRFTGESDATQRPLEDILHLARDEPHQDEG